MMLQGQIPLLLTIGKVLSAVTLVLVLAAVASVWRRTSFPGAAYGGISLSTKRLRWVWFMVLVGAFGFGVNGDPIAVSTHSMEDPEAAAAAEAKTTVSLTLPLPFYRYERERTYGGGALVEEQILEGIVLPWPLISALIAYLVLVLRWNPESRRARRILQGRRWKEEPGAPSE